MLCPLCQLAITADTFFVHIRKFHNSRKNVTLFCPLGGEQSCRNAFTSVSGTLKHYYRWHHVSCTPPSHIVVPVEVVVSGSVNDMCEGTGTEEALFDQNLQDEVICHEEALRSRHQETHPDTTNKNQRNRDEIFEVNLVMPCVNPGEDTIPDQSVQGVSVVMECSDELAEKSTSVQESDEVCDKEFEEYDSDENYEDLSDEEDNDEVTAAFRVRGRKEHKVDISSINSNAADLLLYLRRKCTVPQNAIDGVLEKCESLIKSQILKFIGVTSPALSARNINVGSIPNIKESVEKCSKVFEGIDTKWKQDKYYQQKYNVVPPLRVFVGRHLRRKRKRKTGLRQNLFVENSVVYNPIISSLEKLVNHPDYVKVIDPALFNPNENVLDSFTKSKRYKRSIFFKKHPDAIRLQLYYDEFDSCDAIASKAGRHKIGGFYLTPDNVHPRYRSNLDFIILVALCKASTIKDVGMDVILKPILKDLKKLEKGVVLVNGRVLYATLVSVIGDNLGIHALCGFKEGFTAFRTCHHCMADPDELHSMSTERGELLRNETVYEQQIEKLSAAKTKKCKDELSTEYGLNRGCSLNELKTFHVIGSVIADIMHDLLEGVLPLHLKKLLHHLISGEQPVMTLEWINEVLADFDWEYSEVVNKPSLIRKNHVDEQDGKLHQNSAQTWQLAMYLPIILGPHISAGDAFWDNYLTLVEVCKVVFSPEICMDDVDDLSDLIEQYLTEYIKLYGNLIPKQHFILHYPRLILENGPLTLYSCMRMEAFHRRFKRKAYSLGNYICIEASLGKSYALDQAVVLAGSLLPTVKYGPVKKFRLQDRPYSNLMTGTEYVVEANWVKHNGLTVIPNRCHLTTDCIDMKPTFALVKNILVWPELIYVCQLVSTTVFNPNMNAFQIHSIASDPLVALRPFQVLGHSVFHCHHVNSNQWIVTKYSIKGSF